MSSSNDIAESRVGSNPFLVFEVAHPERTNSMMVSRSREYAPAYVNLTLGGAELEEVKSLRIFRKTLTFETHLSVVVSKAVRNLVQCAGQ